MKNKYTIIFIPPDQSSTQQFRISKRGSQCLFAGLLLVGVIIIGLFARNFYLTYYLKELQPAITNINQLKYTIKERDQEINNLTEQSNQANKDLKKIDELEAKLSSILKIKPTSSAASLSRSTNITTQSYTPYDSSNSSNCLANPSLADHINILEQYYDAALRKKDQLDHTPSILPVRGEITSSFGYRHNPFGGLSSEYHNGVDIACDYGTPVLAAADGVVIFAGWNSVYGEKVEISHGNGIVTFYGHNSRLMVKRGDYVHKSEIIAYSGNSGRSTGSHLHYGAIVNGKNVNPLTFTLVN